MDRRKKYTRKVLNESLLTYMKEKPLSKISVTEICKDADVNRSTYYAHFTDPYDQFSKLKADIIKTVTDFTKEIEVQNIPDGLRQYKVLLTLLEYVEKRKELFQIILRTLNDYEAQQYLVMQLGEHAFAAQNVDGMPPDEIEYHRLFISSGCFGIFYKWLMEEDGMTAKNLAHFMVRFAK